MYKINTSPKSLMGKTRGADCCKFYKKLSSKSEVLEVRTITRCILVGIKIFLRRRRAEAQEQTVWDDTASNGSLSLSAIGRGGIFSPGIKEWTGTIELPQSLTNKQGCLLRAPNLDAGFLLHFT